MNAAMRAAVVAPRATATMIAMAAAITMLGGCGGRASSIPFYRTAAMTPEWLSPREASAPSMHRVAAFDLLDQNGRHVTQRALDGHVTIVQFFFTHCGDLCPMTTAHLRTMLRALPGQPAIQILSYSVDSRADSVTALRAYALARGIADPRWRLLTGDSRIIRRLARESYFVRLGDDTTYGVAHIAHTESLVLVDGQRRIRGVYAGTLQLEIDRLRDDARAVAAEQGAP